MEKNQENFGDNIKSFAEIADLIEKNSLLKDEEVQIKLNLEKPKYDKILKHFRELIGIQKSFLLLLVRLVLSSF